MEFTFQPVHPPSGKDADLGNRFRLVYHAKHIFEFANAFRRKTFRAAGFVQPTQSPMPKGTDHPAL